MSYFSSSLDAVEFVARALKSSRRGSALTMTIGRDKSGVFFAHTVIDELSVDIASEEEKSSSEPPMSILQLPTQAG